MVSTLDPDVGVVRIRSAHSVHATADRLEAGLKARGVLVFARIDFSADAARAGLGMQPEQLLIFGNPKAGTPLMLAAPSVALDLPLKILVAEDAQGKVSLSYNSPQYLKERYGLPANLLPNIAVIETLAAKAAE